jgi:DNA repair exonuclease SbcCD nuclease subunit
MKLAVVGDLHLGHSPSNLARFDNIFESQQRFFKDCLIPELKKQGITDILFTGDVFDQRRRIDVKIMQYVEGLFENDLKDFNCIVLEGNHDAYLKDDLSITSLSLIWNKKNVKVINKFTPMTFGKKKTLIVPWLTSALEKQFLDNLGKIKLKYDYVFGHFEICGFVYEAGVVAVNGLNPIDLFDNFKNTISGHFHTRSEKESDGHSINYVGTPYQLTFGDIGEEKGFWIFDMDTDEKTFIKNNVSNEFIKLRSLEEIKEYDSFEKYFVEFIYNSKMSREEIFLIEKEISNRNPILLKTQFAEEETIEIAEEQKEERNIEEMSDAVISDDMSQISRVFLKAFPHDEENLIIELINSLKTKIHG